MGAQHQEIIAEVGSVHDGSLGNACKLIELAADCGATAVKFQTHIAEAETLPDAPAPKFFNSESRWTYFERTAFSPNEWETIRRTCQDNGVKFVSSPFSTQAVSLLESVDVQAYKIASGEVTNLPLLERVAETQKPVYVSSGMNSWQELDCAVEVLTSSCPVVVMQCTSMYPCPPENVGLNVLDLMRDRYRLTIGFSDHTEGHAAAFAAAARGAKVIEKHITFSRWMYGSDAQFGMEPKDFAYFVRGIREIWQMLDAPVDKDNLEQFQDVRQIFQKSIVTAQNIPVGTKLSRKHLDFKKPGSGIPASDYRSLLGRTTKRSIAKNQQLSLEDLT